MAQATTVTVAMDFLVMSSPFNGFGSVWLPTRELGVNHAGHLGKLTLPAEGSCIYEGRACTKDFLN